MLAFPLVLTVVLGRLDKDYFLCPVYYPWDMIVRNDSRGEGSFAANRNGNRVHQGVDLSAAVGTPVMASRSGYASVKEQKNGMGLYVVIDHGDRLSTLYGHLLSAAVADGVWVCQGQTIGRVGKSGNANHPAMLPHLHFEVRRAGIVQDPGDYLR